MQRFVFAMLATAPLAGCATPMHYACQRAGTPITVDGRMDEAAWSKAAWTDDFVDIEGVRKPMPRFRTRAKMLWDDTNLYFGAYLDEPHVSAMLKQHDEIVFHDNDFEVFIDPDGDTEQYYEIEVNAHNTIFDLFLVRTYRHGGPALHCWDCKGMQTAIHIDGTLNDPADVDQGWSVEVAIPWTTLKEAAHRDAPPKAGDTWRINFSRVEWKYDVVDGKYCKVPDKPEDNWVWSPQGVIDMHRPEKWGRLTFVGDAK